VYREMCDTHACPLKEVRTTLVFGSGNANADLMFVGEAPGANEDKQGLPFVGRAGALLDQLLLEVGIRRSDVFITNVICCRPPGNRDPLPEEIAACEPYLYKKIELIEPKVICTLGNFATKLLTGNPTGITRVHGRPQEREVGGRTVQLFPIFHPAAALRTDSIKQLLREDFAKLPALLADHAPVRSEATPAADGGQETANPGDAEQLGLFQ
ncbi:MAG TPA: uracil-DNA glycosylase, partial [Thermoleophilaceae bacterium]|nr:uracil-DNA glycosylase [Thermoleophilaceae bacterium]